LLLLLVRWLLLLLLLLLTLLLLLVLLHNRSSSRTRPTRGRHPLIQRMCKRSRRVIQGWLTARYPHV